MRSKTVQMHYCDFCKKKGMRPDIIKEHERRCTGNPNRICGMCELIGNINPPIEVMAKTIEKLVGVEIFPNLKGPLPILSVEEIRKVLVHDCPACLLAVIRFLNKKESNFVFIDFDYKRESEKWFKLYNESLPRPAYCDS